MNQSHKLRFVLVLLLSMMIIKLTSGSNQPKNVSFLVPFEKRLRWVQWWVFDQLSLSPAITKVILSYLKLNQQPTSFLAPFEKRPRWVQWWVFNQLSISPAISTRILSYLKLNRTSTELCLHSGEYNKICNHPVVILSPDEH